MERLTDKEINYIALYQRSCDDNHERGRAKWYEMAEKLRHFENLEEEIGCPLEVRCKVSMGTCIYDGAGNEYNVDLIFKNEITCTSTKITEDVFEKLYSFEWKSYGKTWWLKEDKSE